MIQQHRILLHASKQQQFCWRIGSKVPNFLPVMAQKVAWLGTDDGDSGAGLVLHHHSLDPYGGHGMIQHHHSL